MTPRQLAILQPLLADWNRGVQRARAQYEAMPTTSNRVAEMPRVKCACGRFTQSRSGVCQACTDKDKNR